MFGYSHVYEWSAPPNGSGLKAERLVMTNKRHQAAFSISGGMPHAPCPSRPRLRRLSCQRPLAGYQKGLLSWGYRVAYWWTSTPATATACSGLL
jgi:hypothetical protein